MNDANVLLRLEKAVSLVTGLFKTSMRREVDEIWKLAEGTDEAWPFWELQVEEHVGLAKRKIREFFEVLGGTMPSRKVLHLLRVDGVVDASRVAGVPVLKEVGGDRLWTTEGDLQLFLKFEGCTPEGKEVSAIARLGNNENQAEFHFYSFAIISKTRWDAALNAYAKEEYDSLSSAEKRLRFI